MRTVSIDREDGWFHIADPGMEVTSQGPATIESLLLADALAAYENCAADLLGIASDASAPGNVFKEELDEGR